MNRTCNICKGKQEIYSGDYYYYPCGCDGKEYFCDNCSRDIDNPQDDGEELCDECYKELNHEHTR